jgi:hypothetical protein
MAKRYGAGILSTATLPRIPSDSDAAFAKLKLRLAAEDAR